MMDGALRRFLQERLEGPLRTVRLKGDGSDRTFYRVLFGGGTAVALDHRSRPKEAESYFRIGTHLRERGIPVPRILAYEPGQFFLLEDLGDSDLSKQRREGGESHVEPFYEQAVEILIRMRREAFPGFDVRWCADDPSYTARFAFRRESMYFIEECVRNVFGLAADEPELEQELRDLARQIQWARPRSLIHRDFQSRNLMVCQGRVRVIDFQGARLGPVHYDLASLVYDPYVMLSVDFRSRLVERYISSSPDLARSSSFLRRFHLVAMHRLMQALGAFSFLGTKKAKDGFLEHIPGGVIHLYEVWNALGAPGRCLGNLLFELMKRVDSEKHPSELFLKKGLPRAPSQEP